MVDPQMTPRDFLSAEVNGRRARLDGDTVVVDARGGGAYAVTVRTA